MDLVFSPAADQDLEEIGDYIARDNPIRAVTFIREIREHCQNIAAMPNAAPLWPELGPSIRMVTHGQYLIFYEARDAAVRIERVLHGARDIQRLF